MLGATQSSVATKSAQRALALYTPPPLGASHNSTRIPAAVQVLVARDRWLRPGGAMLPDVARVLVAGAGEGALDLDFWKVGGWRVQVTSGS
jgi:hypothetical protein